ncbi:MAG: TetR/AcrR family transcriptional regulator [Thiolinea sp.]
MTTISDSNIAHSIQTPGNDGATLWLDAAYQVLISQGVDKIRITALAEMVDSTRTAFYWYFASRQELLDKLIERWQAKNTGNLIARIDAYAATVNEAVFNMFDCWLEPELFDAPFDLAVRNWANGDAELAQKVREADEARIAALIRMFERFDYPATMAFTRAHTVYYTQIGYISMMVSDDPVLRIQRMPDYVEVYTGIKPGADEIERFMARHRVEAW